MDESRIFMVGGRVGGVVESAITHWNDLDSDWQGVLVGATVVVFVGLFGVDIPW